MNVDFDKCGRLARSHRGLCDRQAVDPDQRDHLTLLRLHPAHQALERKPRKDVGLDQFDGMIIDAFDVAPPPLLAQMIDPAMMRDRRQPRNERARAGATPRHTRRPDVTDWRVRRALEQIDARIGEDLRLADLAAAAGLSPSRFTALFRDALGCSPHMWMTRRRIERACDWLLDPRRSITAIALDLGFSSSQHFATTFRNHKRMTPSAWRKMRLG